MTIFSTLVTFHVAFIPDPLVTISTPHGPTASSPATPKAISVRASNATMLTPVRFLMTNQQQTALNVLRLLCGLGLVAAGLLRLVGLLGLPPEFTFRQRSRSSVFFDVSFRSLLTPTVFLARVLRSDFQATGQLWLCSSRQRRSLSLGLLSSFAIHMKSGCIRGSAGFGLWLWVIRFVCFQSFMLNNKEKEWVKGLTDSCGCIRWNVNYAGRICQLCTGSLGVLVFSLVEIIPRFVLYWLYIAPFFIQ
ncbi:hypothetical protein HanIR_Chr13g0659631 [Helianthus annuus]|nr:hypothetical protein HanIR_Chr13g0659631 [Helianthus annuus]